MAAAGSSGPDYDALVTRRALLMAGLAQSLRLPDAPTLASAGGGATPKAAKGEDAAAAGAATAPSDGVFLRLMALPKGRSLLARALRAIYPPPELAAQRRAARAEPPPANARVLWALLRNLRAVFSPHGGGGAEDAGATAKVAAAATDVLRALHSPAAVADALAAVLAGDLDPAPLLDSQPEAVFLPLLAADMPGVDVRLFPWLAHLLAALLARAAEFEMGPAVVPPKEAAQAAASWRAGFPRLYAMLHAHAAAVHGALKEARALGDPATVAEVTALVPLPLLRAMLPHCDKDQAAALRSIIADVEGPPPPVEV